VRLSVAGSSIREPRPCAGNEDDHDHEDDRDEHEHDEERLR
jgi:hypothetical protein